LREIAEGKKTMNENCDIFELTLRRYHFQFVEMFPLATDTKKKREPISLIIEDPTVRAPPKLTPEDFVSMHNAHMSWQARALWDQHVGKAVYLCDFEVRWCPPDTDGAMDQPVDDVETHHHREQDFFQNVVLKAYGSTDHLEEMRYCMAYFLNFPRGTVPPLIKRFLHCRPTHGTY
jgi:hypothetical protein